MASVPGYNAAHLDCQWCYPRGETVESEIPSRRVVQHFRVFMQFIKQSWEKVLFKKIFNSPLPWIMIREVCKSKYQTNWSNNIEGTSTDPYAPPLLDKLYKCNQLGHRWNQYPQCKMIVHTDLDKKVNNDGPDSNEVGDRVIQREEQDEWIRCKKQAQNITSSKPGV